MTGIANNLAELERMRDSHYFQNLVGDAEEDDKDQTQEIRNIQIEPGTILEEEPEQHTADLALEMDEERY